jgi:predicted lipoprotein
MKHVLTLCLALAASPVAADVRRAVDDYILPGYAGFAEASAHLRDVAAQDCNPEVIKPAWNYTFDAWLNISHLHFGPVEVDGRAVIIAFWPDERGASPRALAGLIAAQDPIIATRDGTAQISAAARGIYALEYLLFDPQLTTNGDYNCALTRALTVDLAHISEGVLAEWQTRYAETLRTAGDSGNQTYLTRNEGIQALFTSILAGIEFNTDKRLDRPLGTFDRPRPNRAESWRSERSLRNLTLSLQGLKVLKDTMSDAPTLVTDAAFTKTFQLIEQLDDPIFAGVADPQGRFKIEILQQAIQAVRDAVEVELRAQLGVDAGFNSADGD